MKDGGVVRSGIPAAVAAAAAILGVAIVIAWVDLAPRVEPDFFFSADDPQFRATEAISNRFPSAAQIIIRAGGDVAAPDYRAAIRELSDAVRGTEGVLSANSIATDDAANSPLWRRLLLTPNGDASNLIVQTDTTDPRILVPRIESVVRRFDRAPLALELSGVPVVIELIRRSLLRDLIVFSSAAFVVFGVLVGIVYRRSHVMAGMLAACVAACSATLIITQLLGMSIGLLTANIAVIVFVLTLSHTVFLTENWRRACQNVDTTDSVAAALGMTLWPSFWCMLTTLLGFLSLQLASAKPLRELGMVGAIGTITALVVAYTIFPAFLRLAATSPDARPDAREDFFASRLPVRHPRRWLFAIAAIVLLAALGVPRIETDPSLLSYFARGTELRDGLELIDHDGGSSPLNVVVEDRDGGRLDTDAANRKMWALQELLEADPDIGVTLSPAVLLAHAKNAPLAGLLNWSQLLDVLGSPMFNRIALSFVTSDRTQGLFFIRMRESNRTGSREAAVDRIDEYVRSSGLNVVLIGGQFELQAQLGRLISSSLKLGLGGLITLFVVIAFVVARSKRVALAMVSCLAGIPLFVIGVMGHAGAAIDIVSSPAANVALAMGVDSMIHLVVRARRLAAGAADNWSAWVEARRQLWRPILSAAVIICAGFGIFSLSTFPPSQRFGVAVILGTLAAAVMTLIALPFGAAAQLRHRRTRLAEVIRS